MTSIPYTDAHLKAVLTRTKTIAMVGVSAKTVRPSWMVGNYLSRKGFRIIPVNPGIAGQSLFGQVVHPSLAEIPPEDGPVHMVDIFRRSDHVEPFVVDALDHLAGRGLFCIWLQLGVVNEAAAKRAEAAGLTVIMDRCPKMEYQRLVGELSWGGVNSGIISSRL